ACFHRDTGPGALVQRLPAGHLGLRQQHVAGPDRAVKPEVLLTVHDLADQLRRNDLQHRLHERVEHRDDREDRAGDRTVPMGRDRVVGRRRVLLQPLAGDLEPDRLGPLAQAVRVEAQLVGHGAASGERNCSIDWSGPAWPCFSIAVPSAPTIICPSNSVVRSSFEPSPARSTAMVMEIRTPAMPVPEIFSVFGGWNSSTVHVIVFGMPIIEMTSVNRAPVDNCCGRSSLNFTCSVSHFSKWFGSPASSNTRSGVAGSSTEVLICPMAAPCAQRSARW